MKLYPLADIRAMSQDDIVQFATANASASASTYLNVAKAIVALDGKASLVLDALKGKGVDAARAKNAVKNAAQAVAVWDAVVALGYADEAWFDRHTYADFVLLNRALKKSVADGLKGAEHFVAEGVFKMTPAKMDVWLENFVAPAPAPKADVKTPAAQPAAAATPTTETPPAKEETAPKATKRPDVAAIEKIEAAEKAVLSIIDLADQVTAEKVIQRLISAKLAAEAARDKRWAPVKLEGLQQLQTRATA